jgi:hypothetical protein
VGRIHTIHGFLRLFKDWLLFCRTQEAAKDFIQSDQSVLYFKMITLALYGE